MAQNVLCLESDICGSKLCSCHLSPQWPRTWASTSSTVRWQQYQPTEGLWVSNELANVSDQHGAEPTESGLSKCPLPHLLIQRHSRPEEQEIEWSLCFCGGGVPKFIDVFLRKMRIAQIRKILCTSLGEKLPFPSFSSAFTSNVNSVWWKEVVVSVFPTRLWVSILVIVL